MTEEQAEVLCAHLTRVIEHARGVVARSAELERCIARLRPYLTVVAEELDRLRAERGS